MSRSDSSSPHGFCITFLKGRSFFSDRRCQCQVTPGHSSRWLEWGNYVVVRMIWNLQATAGLEVRVITHPVSVFVFFLSSFFSLPWLEINMSHLPNERTSTSNNNSCWFRMSNHRMYFFLAISDKTTAFIISLLAVNQGITKCILCFWFNCSHGWIGRFS